MKKLAVLAAAVVATLAPPAHASSRAKRRVEVLRQLPAGQVRSLVEQVHRSLSSDPSATVRLSAAQFPHRDPQIAPNTTVPVSADFVLGRILATFPKGIRHGASVVHVADPLLNETVRFCVAHLLDGMKQAKATIVFDERRLDLPARDASERVNWAHRLREFTLQQKVGGLLCEMGNQPFRLDEATDRFVQQRYVDSLGLIKEVLGMHAHYDERLGAIMREGAEVAARSIDQQLSRVMGSNSTGRASDVALGIDGLAAVCDEFVVPSLERRLDQANQLQWEWQRNAAWLRLVARWLPHPEAGVAYLDQARHCDGQEATLARLWADLMDGRMRFDELFAATKERLAQPWLQ